MNAQDRAKLARLEGILHDLDGYERAAVARMQADGWKFETVKTARDWLRNHLAALRVTAQASESMTRMLNEASTWRRR